MLTDKQLPIYRREAMPERAEEVFRAIADPTRRRILDLLADRERPVKDLADRFPVSQPALSQHLRVLREAGLVRIRREGRMRVYSVHAPLLRVVHDWVGRFERLWLLHSAPSRG
jgi:DNA-binding transcriptional ArsR family regulator